MSKPERSTTANNVVAVNFTTRQIVPPLATNSTTGTIDLAAVNASRRKLTDTLLQPAQDSVQMEAAEEHAAEPIKNVEDIDRICAYLLGQERYRDYMLFVVGINLGLRVSDLLTLRFCHFIDDSFAFRRTFPIIEKKTRNTRKVTKNRYLTINDAVMDAITLYLTHRPAKLDDYLFRSESNNGAAINKPMSSFSVERILKGIGGDLGLGIHLATHTLRKTFGYHQMAMGGNDPRRLLLLQKIFGHSTSTQTLDYIGITIEEIEDAYLNLNLASKQCYAKFSQIGENTVA